jgi:membrane associated rhomboid family serine protease
VTLWVRRLLVANAAVFVLTMLFPGITVFLQFTPRYVLILPWTPVTYMFVHAGMQHIFFNMLGLYFFGQPVENRLGTKRFLWLYFLSGLCGAAASFIFDWSHPIVGASAAVMGVMFAFAYYWPREKILFFMVLPVEAWLGVIIMSGLDLFSATGGFDQGVAHFAHLGGVLGAWAYLLLSGKFTEAARFKQRAAVVKSKKATEQDAERWAMIPREGLHPLSREELDRILDKISKSGLASLTVDERAFLDRFVN